MNKFSRVGGRSFFERCREKKQFGDLPVYLGD